MARPAAPHGWSLDHNPGHRATVLSGFIPLFFFPLAGSCTVFFFFLLVVVVVSGSNRLFYKRFPVRAFCFFTGENGCLINPEKKSVRGAKEM